MRFRVWVELGVCPDAYQSEGGYYHVGGIRKTKIGSDGREYVHLRREGGNSKTKQVSRLVATAYHANPDNLPEANHLDGDPLNNRAKNLEWSTVEDNRQHAIDNRLYPSIPLEIVSEIKDEYKARKRKGITVTDIAEKYGVSLWTVRRIGMPSSSY